MRGDLLRLGFVDIQLVRQQVGCSARNRFHVLQVQPGLAVGQALRRRRLRDKDAAVPNTRTENKNSLDLFCASVLRTGPDFRRRASMCTATSIWRRPHAYAGSRNNFAAERNGCRQFAASIRRRHFLDARVGCRANTRGGSGRSRLERESDGALGQKQLERLQLLPVR